MGILRWLGDQDKVRVLTLDEVVAANIGHDLGAWEHLDMELILDFLSLQQSFIRESSFQSRLYLRDSPLGHQLWPCLLDGKRCDDGQCALMD